ncbi:BREX protein BrxB domain-containing protein [Desulfonatronum parangueonense]
MSLLDAHFDELMARIRHGRDLSHASFEPVYYLIFPPAKILEVKRVQPAWIARLRNAGWQVHTFSLGREILKILSEAPQRALWLKADAKNPLAWDKTNQSLANLIIDTLPERLGTFLDGIQETKSSIVLITDLEALHPYMRIGAIEGKLAGRFKTTTVIFYPGERAGTKLQFFGFYHPDGNYRSVHVGG